MHSDQNAYCRLCYNRFSRERLRRVLRKKTSAEERLIYILTSSPLHIYIHILISTSHLHLLIFTSTITSAHLHLCSSSHPHIYISAHLHLHTSTSLLMFTSAHLHLCSSSHPHIYCTSHIFTSRSSLLSLLRPGAVPPEHHETQPSAEIVRVEGAKCRRECGDRACRGREMQARVRRSCVSRARNAGESAFWPGPAPSTRTISAEGCAGPGQNPLSPALRALDTHDLRRGLPAPNPKRTLACLSRPRRSNLWSWKLRTGDFVVQLEYAEYLGSWKMRTGDFLVQL